MESIGTEEELGSGDVVGLMEHHIDVPRGPLGLPGQGSIQVLRYAAIVSAWAIQHIVQITTSEVIASCPG